MSTIKVRNISLDRLGLRTARLLYNELPAVRSYVHSWFDGDVALLLRKENAAFLRRLVVRSLRESMSSHEEVDSYGGTSCDDVVSSSYPCPSMWDSIHLPVSHVRIEDAICDCSRCGARTNPTRVIKTRAGEFHAFCGSCYIETFV
jgi:hypothetical protein